MVTVRRDWNEISTALESAGYSFTATRTRDDCVQVIFVEEEAATFAALYIMGNWNQDGMALHETDWDSETLWVNVDPSPPPARTDAPTLSTEAKS